MCVTNFLRFKNPFLGLSAGSLGTWASERRNSGLGFRSGGLEFRVEGVGLRNLGVCGGRFKLPMVGFLAKGAGVRFDLGFRVMQWEEKFGIVEGLGLGSFMSTGIEMSEP